MLGWNWVRFFSLCVDRRSGLVAGRSWVELGSFFHYCLGGSRALLLPGPCLVVCIVWCVVRLVFVSGAFLVL